MGADKAFVLGMCTRCGGKGVCRNPRHFFYGISLIASGLICFFEWPPTPWLFTAIWGATTQFGLPAWVGSALIWVLTGVPPLFGLGFVYAWLARDTCPACCGRGKTTQMAVDTPCY